MKKFTEILNGCDYILIVAKKWQQSYEEYVYHSVTVSVFKDGKETVIGNDKFRYGHDHCFLSSAAMILNFEKNELTEIIQNNENKFAIFCKVVAKEKDL